MAEESLSHAVEETRHNALGDCPNFRTDDVRIFTAIASDSLCWLF